MQAATVMICALDQFVAIVKPLYYNCFKAKVTKYLFGTMIGFWLSMVPIPVAMLLNAEHLNWVPSFSGCGVYIKSDKLKRFLLLGLYGVNYIVPGLIIVVCYITIALTIKRSARKRAQLVLATNTVTAAANPSGHASTGGLPLKQVSTQ
ncbi:G-protein coupled receptor 183-like [Convolutriloba macropyga]|uniref:G-protein coupled receptor 183-like n=1 Tax=Convolutriloba macropyga TaxID=536237 RepID=UPI003F522552